MPLKPRGSFLPANISSNLTHACGETRMKLLNTEKLMREDSKSTLNSYDDLPLPVGPKMAFIPGLKIALKHNKDYGLC